MSEHQSIEGWWRVESCEMPEGRTLTLLGGLPGEYVRFNEDGRFWIHPGKSGSQQYRCFESEGRSGLDVWIPGLETLTVRCIYEISGDSMRVCIAGRELNSDKDPERPTSLERDDSKNWVLMNYTRCAKPRSRLMDFIFRRG